MRIYVALAIAAVVGACATNPDTIDPIYVATDAEQVGLLKGAMEALEQISIEKGCNIEFQHG
jgi:hypothetical protein